METMILMGGDARMKAAAEAFRAAGCAAQWIWAEGESCPCGAQLQTLLQTADALVLPVPALTADGRISTSCRQPAPKWAELCGWLKSDCLVSGGGIEDISWPRKLDLLTDEGFALANAVPAALASADHGSIQSDSTGRGSMTRCGTVSSKQMPRSAEL